MIKILSLALGIALVTGCSQKTPELESGAVMDAGMGNINEGLGNDTIDAGIDSMTGYDSSSESYGSEDERVMAVEGKLQPVYFGTDRYDISATESEKIDTDANILNSSVASDLRINVEGNCDEWGTDEYNYALGLKRAKSTKDALMAAGVDVSRMSIVSFGESKPMCSDHNAECWQQNRRADIKVRP
jgi:peptidoglycan-associated lipoprotein